MSLSVQSQSEVYCEHLWIVYVNKEEINANKSRNAFNLDCPWSVGHCPDDQQQEQCLSRGRGQLCLSQEHGARVWFRQQDIFESLRAPLSNGLGPRTLHWTEDVPQRTMWKLMADSWIIFYLYSKLCIKLLRQ